MTSLPYIALKNCHADTQPCADSEAEFSVASVDADQQRSPRYRTSMRPATPLSASRA